MNGNDVRRVALAATALLALVGIAGRLALAEPMPKEECDKLQVEQAALEKGGIKEVLLKGPVWGRANLSGAKLKDVERYITIEEYLSFRCGLARARLTLPFAEEDQPPASPEETAKAEAGAPAATAPPPKPKPKPKPKAEATPPAEKVAAPTEAAPKPAAKPKPKPKADPSEQAAAPEAAPKPAAKAKPKPDDAFKPPPSQGKDPFAGQIPIPPKSP